MRESDYYLCFSLAPGIGPKRFKSLFMQFGSAEKAFETLQNDVRLPIDDVGIGEKTITAFREFMQSFNVEEYKNKLTKSYVYFIPQESSDYSQELFALDNPPIGLFVKGNIECLKTKKFGVVGTRKITSYGKDITQMLTGQLVTYGYTIVSGLALGVDAVAHKTTLESNGKAIAILGCGVDCCNPSENMSLYNSILQSRGLIISEYPLGVPPTKGSFPARNRLIAALSTGVLVPEAGADSGSLITADYARKLGKNLFAVPGPITSKQSGGTSYLLQQGATLVTRIEDIIQKMGDQKIVKKTQLSFESLDITSDEKTLLNLLQDEELSFNELIQKSKLATMKVGALLGNLELVGLIFQKNDGRYSLTNA